MDMKRENTVRDPVCGMRFKPEDAACTHTWEGVVLHFCCEHCRASFLEDPRRYLHRGEEVVG